MKETEEKFKSYDKYDISTRFGVIHYISINISKNRLRTILTILGIAIPIAFFILFAAMGEGLDQYIENISETSESNRQNYTAMSNIISAWTNVLLFIIAIMIITSISNTILMSVSDRKFEFGILKAIGIHQDQIVYLVLLEAGIISVIALLVGLIIGYWSSIIFDYMFWLDEGAGFIFAPAIISTSSIILVSFLTILMGTLTALYPAIIASRKDAIEIIRCE